MKLYPVGWFQAPSSSFELFSGSNRHDAEQQQTSQPDFDEMVHVDGKQVVWSAGSGGAQRVFKSYRQVLSAKQALLCAFVGVGAGDESSPLGVTGDSQVGDAEQPGQSVPAGRDHNVSQPGAASAAPTSSESGQQDDRCLCVLQGLECVKIYAPDGAEFEVALPCKAARMWALPRGLLIERAVPAREGDDNDSTSENGSEGDNRSAIAAKSDPLYIASDDCPQTQDQAEVLSPMFFSLLHPLEELKPVSFTVTRSEFLEQQQLAAGAHSANSSGGNDAGPVPSAARGGRASVSLQPIPSEFELADEGDEVDELDSDELVSEFMCDRRERILMVDNQLCLIVTYHEGKRAHSVWCLLPATAVRAASSRQVSPASHTPPSSARQAEYFGDDSKPYSSRRRASSDLAGEVASELDSELDEDDDDVIESEVFMQRIWTEEAESDSADDVFIAHDPEGLPLICLMHNDRQVLRALSVKTESRHRPLAPAPTDEVSLLSTPLPSLMRSTPRDKLVVRVAFTLPVKSAQPIMCTGSRSILDLVVITNTGELELYRGQVRLCSLNVVTEKVPPWPILEGTSLMSAERQVLPGVRRLEHAVSNRVNLLYEDGRSLRVTTAMGFHSRLLRPCLQGIDSALPADVSLRLRVDVAVWYDTISHSKSKAIHNLAMQLVGEGGLARTGMSVDLEWAAFVIVVSLLIIRAGGSASCDQESPQDVVALNENDGDWFNRMLQTDFHFQYEQENRPTLRYFQHKESNSTGQTRAPEQTACPAWFQTLDSVSPGIISSAEGFSRHINVLVLCLHLVYEECKLSTLTWQLVRPMACLLGGLAEATLEASSAEVYLDHYKRDLGAFDAIPFPLFSKEKRVRMSMQTPPDLLHWLEQRMKKASSRCRAPASTAHPVGVAFPFGTGRTRPEDHLLRSAIGLSATMRPFPELDSCFKTQQICCFLELLCGGSGDDATVAPLEFRLNKDSKRMRAASNSPVVSAFVTIDSSFAHWMHVHGYEARSVAERTVLGMVWFGFTLQDLETLTFGLHIPLREALHLCRNRPSGRWPADAYVLVGREDMAALALAPSPPQAASRIGQDENEGDGEEGRSVSMSFPLDSSSPVPAFFEPPLPPPQALQTPVVSRAHAYRSSSLSFERGGGHSRSSSVHSVSRRDGALHSAGYGTASASRYGTGRGTSGRRRASDASLTSITTAVTPVYRRLPQGQGPAAQVAEDILWSGRHAPGVARSTSFLDKQQQARGSSAFNSAATRRLLSIADFARLSASASAEVGTSLTGNDQGEGGGAPHTSSGPAGAGQASGAGHGQSGSGVGGSGGEGPGDGRGQGLNDPSGFGLLQRMTTLRFGSDRRVREVCRLLRSSAPVRLTVERGPETSDHELVAAQQAKLLLLSRRTLAMPVGRGMITLGTVRPLLTDTVEIPTISLGGKIPPNNAVVKLDLAAVNGGDTILDWPRFHNGVAAGLRLSAGRQVTPLTRTWIAYNRPEVPNSTHAGFLLALGLHGHLAALTNADVYEYLSGGHDATTVSILLGMSAAKRGTMAPTVSKMLCLHVPSLLPAAFADMDVTATVQSAALMGLGLLYQSTANRLMCELLLSEIGRRPTSDRDTDRESYSLSAGFALGMVTLGFGGRPNGLSGLADLRLEDKLHRYMVGGLDSEHASGALAGEAPKCSRIREGPYVNVNVTSPGATIALGLIFIKSGNESVAARLAIPDTHFLLDYVRPDLLMLRVLARNLVLWDSVAPTEEWLLEQVPPAIRFSYERLAGGGTTASMVAAATKLHLSHAHAADEDELLDEDVEMVDDDEYDSHDEDEEDRATTRRRASTGGRSLDDPLAPPSVPGTPGSLPAPPTPQRRTMSLGAMTGQRQQSSRALHRLKSRGNSMASMASKVASVGEDSDGKARRNTGVPVDEQAVRQAHANIVAGACFSIGIRFVGTASRPARDLLIKYVRHFAALRNCEKDSPQAAQRPDKSTLEMCLGASAISLALVMAGTGDLDTLRLLRSLRFKTEETVTYGNHMAIGSAIGILFLGGGRVSFSTDNAAIAALIVSFFPRFPMHTNDNQYHLQALRHLYVLAAEERCLDAYDIDSRSPCYLPLEVTLRPNALDHYCDRVCPLPGDTGAACTSARLSHCDTASSATVVKMVAPCLLPPFAWISSIRVASPRYWPVDIELDGEQNQAQRRAIAAYRVLCVKRKVGHLSYMEDPRGVSSLLARPRLKLISQHAGGFAGGPTDLIMKSFTADPHVLAFAKHFCGPTKSGRVEDRQFEEFCTVSLYECLTREKPEMLNAMVDLFQTARVFKDAPHSLHIRNVQLLNAFYSESGQSRDLEEERLIGRRFLASLNSTFERQVSCFNALLGQYVDTLTFPTSPELEKVWKGPARSGQNLLTLFATFLHIHKIPGVELLQTPEAQALNIDTVAEFALNNMGRISPEAQLKIALARSAAWQ